MSNYFLIAFLIATVVVLIIGILFMAIGGKMNAKYSNKLMVMRVVFQACAIGVIGLVYLLSK